MVKKKQRRLWGAKITSTASIALVLFVLGLLLVGGLSATRLSQVLREQFTVTFTIGSQAPAAYGERLAQRLGREPYTAQAIYISPDSAMRIVAEELGENPEEFLGFNPLQPAVELRLKANYAVTDSIEPIVERLQASEGSRIERVDYSRSLVDLVNNNMRRYSFGLAALALVLLLISFSLIGNTVRLALHSERFLINTMQLVGATAWFVRKPFIRAHAVSGFIAALLALAALAGLLYSIDLPQALAAALLEPLPLIILAVTLLLAGILIPSVAAWYAADRYLSRKEDDLYLM